MIRDGCTMKITKTQLRQMIQEELLNEDKLPNDYGIYSNKRNRYILAYSTWNWEPNSSQIAKIEKTLISVFNKLDIPDKKMTIKPAIYVKDGEYVACGLTFTTKSDVEDSGYEVYDLE